ncbi:MAG: hypothetical protein AB7V46_22430 [Thermomicrobiales bacterium]
MNPQTFDRLARAIGTRLSRRSLLAGVGFAGTSTVTMSSGRALAQTPVAVSGEPVLSMRSYIVLATVDDVVAGIEPLIAMMETQPGFLDYRIAELGESTLATISSFLGPEASDAAAAAEAAWIAEHMTTLLTEPVDMISGSLLDWSKFGAGASCQSGTENPCPAVDLTCCPTTTLLGGPGICVNAETTCPPVDATASPVAGCKDEGCECATGTESPCNDGLSCCAESDDTPPGGPGVCRATC